MKPFLHKHWVVKLHKLWDEHSFQFPVFLVNIDNFTKIERMALCNTMHPRQAPSFTVGWDGSLVSQVALGSKFNVLWPLVHTQPLNHVALKKSISNRHAKTLLKLTEFLLSSSCSAYIMIIKTHKLIISKVLSLYPSKCAPSELNIWLCRARIQYLDFFFQEH